MSFLLDLAGAVLPVVPVPKGFTARRADTGEGIVFQRPGAPAKGQFKDRDMVRIMDPNNRYPKGYVVYYGPKGNPLDRFGVGGKPRADWHHGLDNDPPPGFVDWFKRLNN